MQNSFPAYVLKTLQILNAAGYEAYVVGGAVRDLLLGIEPGDYDITTNARPEQIVAVLSSADYTLAEKLGENFGVVVAVTEGSATSAMPTGRTPTARQRCGTATH